MFELQSLPWYVGTAAKLPACRRLLFPLLHAETKEIGRRRLHAGNGEAARKNFSRGLAPRQKPETALEKSLIWQAGAECPAVSMATSVTLQRMLSMLSCHD